MKPRRWALWTGAAILASAALLAGYRHLRPPRRDRVAEYCSQADRRFRQGELTAAVVDYNRAIALAPADARPYIGLAVLYEGVERPDLAVLALRQLEASAPGARHLYCRLAEAHLGADDVKQARDLGAVATAREPNCARAFSVYGIALVRYRYWDSAETAIRRAIQLAPEDSQIREVLVDVYAQQGAVAKAFQAAAEALARAPASARLHYKAGWAGSRLPQTTAAVTHDAIAHLRRAAELDPQWFEPWAEMGRIYRSLGRIPEAKTAFETAWKLNSQVPGVAFNLAAVYRLRGDARAAAMERTFNSLIRGQGRLTARRREYNQDPRAESNTLALAEMEGNARMYGTALHRLRKVLAEDPADLRALQLYTRFDRASRAAYPDFLFPGPGIGPAGR
jgi:Flp pilus assembly protein TadD